MRYEIFNGGCLGTVEWRGPGEVAVDVPYIEHRAWLERFFRAYDSVIVGDGAQRMTLERRDSSEAAFNQAVYELAGYTCTPCGVEDHGNGPARSPQS